MHESVFDYRPSFVVTSAQELVELVPGAPTVATIGERINPTGKPHLKEALASGSYDLAISEAVAQIEAGADISTSASGYRALTRRMRCVSLPSAPASHRVSAPAT